MALLSFLQAAFALALAAPFAAQATSAVQSSNPAVFSETTHDFGDVAHGSIMSHTFTVRNAGPTPLRITEVELQAAGMKTSFKPSIGAGETVRLSIEWNSAQLHGTVTGTAIVRFAGELQPAVVLELRANITRSIDILPMPAVFFSVYKGDAATRSVTIVNGEPTPLEITGLEPAGNHFVAAVHPVEAGKTYRVDVTVPGNTETGRFMEKLVVTTNHPARKRLEIAVNVFVKNDLYVSPETVDLGRVSIAELTAQPGMTRLLDFKLIIRKRQGEFAVTSVSTDVPGLSVKSSATAERVAAAQIEVSISPKLLVPGPVAGKIRIETDDTAYPILTVPVTGTVR